MLPLAVALPNLSIAVLVRIGSSHTRCPAEEYAAEGYAVPMVDLLKVVLGESALWWWSCLVGLSHHLVN